MLRYIVNKTDLTKVANAIRAKTGSAAPLEFPREFVLWIQGLQPASAPTAQSLLNKTIATYSDDTLTAVPDSTFADCNALTTVNLPAVTSIGEQAFIRCKNLTSVNAPAVETISASAFSTCEKLEVIDLPSVKSIGSNAFGFTTALKAVILRSADTICTLGAGIFSSYLGSNAAFYVPAAVLETYQTTYTAYTFAAIEGSEYE